MTMQCHFQWHAWTAMGWTEPDLRLVVNHLKRLIRLERRRPESLKFHNLINVDRFSEDLADARAESRVKPVTPRDRILSATGRVANNVTANVRTAAEIMAGNQAFHNFKLWRGETGL